METKKLDYSNFIQSFLQDKFEGEDLSFKTNIFGTNLNDSEYSVDDLFSFAHQQSSNNSMHDQIEGMH